MDAQFLAECEALSAEEANLERERRQAADEYITQKEELRKKRQALQKRCDHAMPDGSSADNGGFAYGMCRLCGITG